MHNVYVLLVTVVYACVLFKLSIQRLTFDDNVYFLLVPVICICVHVYTNCSIRCRCLNGCGPR